MVYIASSPTAARGRVWHGVLMMLVLTFIGLLNVTIFDRAVSFSLLPVLGILLWPRGAPSVFSILAVLIFGLLLDVLTGGPLGLWALVYLALFAVFRPHQRLKPFTFSTASVRVLSGLAFALILAFALAWFANSHRPNIGLMIPPLLAAIMFFPFIYGTRHLLQQLIGNADDRGL